MRAQGRFQKRITDIRGVAYDMTNLFTKNTIPSFYGMWKA